MLDDLKERHRTLLILFEVEELSGIEIAKLTNTKLPTVWVQLHRARAAFLKRMQQIERREGAS